MKGEISGTLFSTKAWPKIDSLKQCQETCQMLQNCKAVSYHPEKRLCWLYRHVKGIYPSDKIYSAPRSCLPNDGDTKYYSMADYAEIWTGNAGKTNIIESMMQRYFLQDENIAMGSMCHDIPVPKACKLMGGFQFSVGYSADGSCHFNDAQLVAENGIQGTCQDIEANPNHLCAFCQVKDELDHIQNVLMPMPQGCQLQCNASNEIQCFCAHNL